MSIASLRCKWAPGCCSNVQFHLMREELAHFGDELLAAGGVLAQNARHFAIETAPVLVGQVLGRDDNDGDTRAIGSLAQFPHESKSVHLGHHQVEEDEAGRALRKLFEAE